MMKLKKLSTREEIFDELDRIREVKKGKWNYEIMKLWKVMEFWNYEKLWNYEIMKSYEILKLWKVMKLWKVNKIIIWEVVNYTQMNPLGFSRQVQCYTFNPLREQIYFTVKLTVSEDTNRCRPWKLMNLSLKCLVLLGLIWCKWFRGNNLHLFLACI